MGCDSIELILGFNLSSVLIYRLINLPVSFLIDLILAIYSRIGSAHAVRRAMGSLVAFVTSIFTVTLNILLVYFKSKSLLMCFYLVVFTLFGPFVDVYPHAWKVILDVKGWLLQALCKMQFCSLCNHYLRFAHWASNLMSSLHIQNCVYGWRVLRLNFYCLKML